MNRQNVGIIGFGRFGQFWAEILSATHQVLVTDQNDLAQTAARLGFQFRKSVSEICTEAEVIFLCVPISQLEETVQSLKEHLKPGTVIFDTCSVKLYPAEVLQTHLGSLDQIELIATHPMFGPDSGANGLEGLPIVMWPLRAITKAYDIWREYLRNLGLIIVETSPDEHDRLVANSQGVTHYIGRVLGEMNLQPTPIDTKGFTILRSVVEQTCHDTWELFHDLQNYNPYTKKMRLQLEEALDQVYSRLLPERVSPGILIIGVQGGRGSFSEEACHDYCNANKITDYSVKYCYTSLNVLAALHQGEIDRGMFAIQNARGGVVMETIEALSRYSCDILDYFDISLSHCILHRPDINFAQIDTLISHPQSLAQCQTNLAKKYPHLNLISGEGDLVDQALCAQHLAEGKLPPTMAVLASKVCADLYDLSIHDMDLQDLGEANLTTFVWVQRRQHHFPKKS
jgi:arogenate dehydrogenase (NADP+)